MKVFMMIGCPYSGKSTYARSLAKKYDAKIVSSDLMRFYLYGDEAIQKNHSIVFEKCRKLLKQYLDEGKNVILDSTSLTIKSRKSYMEVLKKYDNVEVIAVVCAVTLEEIKERQKKRDRFVSADRVKKMLQSFQFPLYGEGFDEIWIKTSNDLTGREKTLGSIVKELCEVSHDTKWHKETIGDHMIQSYGYAVYEHYCHTVTQAALFHDIGKGATKTFMDMKGRKTEDAHFYGHAGIGCYIYAAYRSQQEDTIEICQLISYHMCWAQREEKGLQKLRALMGEELWKKLEQLHDCDEHGRDSDLEAIY